MRTRAQVLRAAGDPGLVQHFSEEGRVQMVLHALGLADEKWDLLDAHEQEFGSRRLTFAGFRQRYPTFPLVLASRHVGVSGRVARRDVFRRADQVFMTDLYLEAHARLAEEAGTRPVGLVLPFGELRGGVVLHNGTFAAGRVRVAIELDHGPPHRVTVEPFRRVLSHLAGSGWSPGARDPVVPPVAPRVERPVAAVEGWMLDRLGPGPAAVLLGWLCRVLASDAAGDRAWVRRFRGGERYVHASQGDLVTQTRMSSAQVKRALERLNQEGLVATARSGGKTNIQVLPPGGA